MTFTDSIKKCLDKYTTMEGRAPRSEYWWFVLFYILMFVLTTIVCGVLGSLIGGFGGCSIAISVGNALLFLILLCPHVCVTVRRLHDTGHSGYWFFVRIIPYILLCFIVVLQKLHGFDELYSKTFAGIYIIGRLWLFILLLQGSDEENEYGLPVY